MRKDGAELPDIAGFTLLELLVVMVIVGILATQVVLMMSSASSRVKAEAFSLRSDLQMARFEAVKRNTDVLVEFLSQGDVDDDGVTRTNDGYRMCLDDDGDGNCDSADTMIRDVTMRQEVRFYADAVGPPAVADGVTFGGDDFIMQPDGTSDAGGRVYLYAPQMSPLEPLQIVVSSQTGRLRIERWRSDTNSWETK